MDTGIPLFFSEIEYLLLETIPLETIMRVLVFIGCFRSNLRGGGFEGVSPQEVFRQQKDHVRMGPRGQELRQAEGGGRVHETIRVPQTKRRTRTNDRG